MLCQRCFESFQSSWEKCARLGDVHPGSTDKTKADGHCGEVSQLLTNKGKFQLFEKEADERTHQHSSPALQAHTCHTSRWKHRPVWQQLVIRGGNGFDGIVVEWCGAGHGVLGHLRHHQRKGVLGGGWIWRGSKRHVGVHGARGWLVAGWCRRTTPGPRRERTCKQERAQLSTAHT